MKLSIPYTEAIQIAKEKSGKEITLAAVDDKTIKVGYILQVKIPLIGNISKEINIDVTYEKIDGEDLYLAYKGGTGLEMIIDGVKFLLPQLVNTNIYEIREGNKPVVHLGLIEKVHEALKSITINDVSFGNEGIEVDFSLK